MKNRTKGTARAAVTINTCIIVNGTNPISHFPGDNLYPIKYTILKINRRLPTTAAAISWSSSIVKTVIRHKIIISKKFL